jgi:carbon starvation protein CstA
MISFLAGIVALVLGYVIYGIITEKVFAVRPDVQTPALRINDGVDYVPMSKWKCLFLQLINIAGTGPIFGAIAGALFGPAAFAWIVFGCIFAGAVHDYTVGMLSLRNNGGSISEIVGKYLGKGPLYVMRVFSLVLLIFVGVVFVTTPALVLETIFAPDNVTFYHVAIAVIIGYYLLATLVPIDKLIGKVYPIMGAIILFMAVSMAFMLFFTGDVKKIPEFAFENLRPDKDNNIMAKLFPFLFITIACGAISGFHATQAPLVARCLKNEKEGRIVFYGAMILEGIIAMIWAAVTMGDFNIVGVESTVSAPKIVTESAIHYMGHFGGIIAVIAVALCPISSGDTAFRSARLLIADVIKLDQKPGKNRLLIAIPLFVAGIALVLFALESDHNFNIIWRYFSWSNQVMATIGLWAVSAYLAKAGKFYWLTLPPATFMTVVVTSYFVTSNECLGPLMTKIFGSTDTTYIFGIVIGLIAALTLFALFVPLIGIKQKGILRD